MPARGLISLKMERRTQKYRVIKENLDLIEKLARHGFSDDDISEFIGTTTQLFREYLKKSTGFSRMVKTAKKKADLDVEESLLKRATGYETIEEYFVYTPTEAESKNEKTGYRIKEIKRVRKTVPPDATSAMAWLNNRKSEKWSKNPGAAAELSNNEITKLKDLALKEMQESI